MQAYIQSLRPPCLSGTSHAALTYLPSLARSSLEVEGPIVNDLLRSFGALCSLGTRRVPMRNIAVLLEHTYGDEARDAG